MTKNKKLNILFLTPRLPFPIIGGDRLKPYNMISHLAKSHNVTLVSFYQGDEVPTEYIQAIESLNAKLHVIPLNPFKAALNSLVSNNPLNPLEINYYTQPEYKAKVQELLSAEKFDLGISFFMRTAEYLKNTTGIKKMLMAEDCRVLYQKRSYQESKSIKQKSVRLFEYLTLKRYEPNIIKHFDITTLVTNNDIQAMKKNAPDAQYRLLTNGTDIEKFRPPTVNAIRKGILFSGKLDVWANVIMVQKIIEEIMPAIWKTLPNAQLTIAGANPGKEIYKYQNDKIKIIPNVPSMIPLLQSAEVFIHPHTGGTGIQNKLLEAMACGTPVVTTPIGNQGIDAIDGSDVLLGNSTKELAEQAIRILQDKELASKISINCRDLIIRTHSWQSVFSAMDAILDEMF